MDSQKEMTKAIKHAGRYMKLLDKYMEIKFRRLFKQAVEGEAYTEAIITYYKSKTHLYEDGKYKIKHLLFIDLWLIEFVFNWESLQNIT